MKHSPDAIRTAFTGRLHGRFWEFHDYAEHLLGRRIWSHEFGSEQMEKKIKELSRADYEALT